MAERTHQRVALMAIHPKYADAILEGRKRVEFRKRRLAADVERVLIYATSPVMRIVGSFTVDATVEGAPSHIWAEFGHVGVIDEVDFHRYYGGCEKAVAIKVAATQKFDRPIALSELNPRPSVPQSFTYIAAQEVA